MQSDGQIAGMSATTDVAPVSSTVPNPAGQTTGVRVAVSMGTVFEEQAKRHFPKAEIKSVQTPATGYQEVLAGRADVTITSNIEASTLVKRFEQLVVDVQGAEMRNKRPFAYVVGQDDFAWQSCLNTWIALKKSEGLFDELERIWLLRA